MGINTQGILNKDVTIEDIANVLETKFNVNTVIEKTHDENYKIIAFEFNGEKRRMSTFINYDDQSHVGFANMGKVTLIDLNLWGSSIELIKGVIEDFGGYMVENDCGDDWQYIEKI